RTVAACVALEAGQSPAGGDGRRLLVLDVDHVAELDLADGDRVCRRLHAHAVAIAGLAATLYAVPGGDLRNIGAGLRPGGVTYRARHGRGARADRHDYRQGSDLLGTDRNLVRARPAHPPAPLARFRLWRLLGRAVSYLGLLPDASDALLLP